MEQRPRAFSVDVFAPDESVRAVRSSIARYRLACRQLFAVFTCAQAAGAELIENARGDLALKPSNDRARQLLKDVFAVDGPAKAPAYACRRWFLDSLYPGARSFVWDSARQLVWDRWKSRDPEFTQAGRGWLILQGARRVGEFRGVGIAFPQATACPKLNQRSLALKWDSAIGQVEFDLGKLDPGGWHTWAKVRDGEWNAGTVTLNERDGRLRATISYYRPIEPESLDSGRVLSVSFVQSQKPLLLLSGPSGEIEALAQVDLLGKLGQLRKQRQLWEERRESAGSPRQAWGNRRAFRNVQSHLSGITLNRSRFVADQNHALSRRIASRAAQWHCGCVSLNIPVGKSLFGHSWAWDQLENFLRYKLEEVGATLTVKEAALESPISIGSPRA